MAALNVKVSGAMPTCSILRKIAKARDGAFLSEHLDNA
jgi:hypothetical protein